MNLSFDSIQEIESEIVQIVQFVILSCSIFLEKRKLKKK